MPRVRTLLLLLPLLGFLGSSKAIPPDSGEPWTVVHQVEGVKVYQRVSSNPDLKEYKAVGVLMLPAWALTAVLRDRPRYTEFFPYLEENRLIHHDDELYSYERISAPLVSERDYTVRLYEEELEGGGYRVRFHDANDAGPAATEDKVRVQVVKGMWEVEAMNKQRSRVTYHVYTDPGGSIPNFIINAANKRGVSRALLALRDRTRELMENGALR